MTLEQIQSQMMTAVNNENYPLALELAKKAVDATKNEKQAWCILNVVDILMNMKKYEEAGKTAITAAEILQPIYGTESYEYSYVCLYLGKVYFHLNKHEVSRQCLDFFVQTAQEYLETVEDKDEKANVAFLLEEARMGILANNECLDEYL